MRGVSTRVSVALALVAGLFLPAVGAAGQPEDGVTFTRDVLPLLQRSCHGGTC